ncbi:TonB-dependent receptor [Candidatus Gracilibacteria bacterium]|nr:TonB-dependent receptor [Candidatus Gracilibacteria bacterium]
MKRWWLLDNFNLWLFIISGLLGIIVVKPGLAEDKKTKLIAGNKEEFESLFLQDKNIKIPRSSEIILVQTPTPNNPSPASPLPRQVVPITGVELNPTDSGAEIILQTPLGQQLQVTNRTEGNNFIAEIQGAQLQLPSGKPFRFQKPAARISEIIVINLDDKTIQITAIGETAPPQVELFDSNEGLIFGFTPVEGLAQTPTSPQPREEQIVTIERVQLNKTEIGFEILLLTPTNTAQQLRVVDVSQENNFIAQIPNAQINLPDAQPFRAENPVEGVSEVTVTNQNENMVLVTVVGEDKQPTVELFDGEEGLIFSLIPPLQGGTQGGQTAQEEDIELVVTGEQEGYRIPNASVGTRTDTPLRDIPQSIQVIPQEVFKDQGSADIEQVLQNAPGVVQGDRSPRYPYTEFFIRGFVSGTETLVNGLPSTVFQYRDVLSNIDRIEVLRGPSSVLYGPGSLGGRINVVTERPLPDPFYSIDVSAGNFDLFNGAIDLSGPLDNDKTVLYRLNAFAETTDSFVDFYDRQRYLVSPVLTWSIGDRTKLTIETEYVSSSIDGIDNGLPAEGTVQPNPNGEIPLDRNLGEPSFFNDTEVFRVGYDFEHRFSENWQMRSAFQFFLYNDEARGFFYGELLDDKRTVERFAAEYRIENRAYNLDNYVVGKFKTGSIQHQLVAGLSLFRQDYAVPFDNDLPGLEPIDIFDPVYEVSTLGEPVPFRRLERQIDQLGIYLQNQITITENLKLLLGGRFDIASQREENLLESTSQFQQDEAFSPRIGFVYQPIEPISLYEAIVARFSHKLAQMRKEMSSSQSAALSMKLGGKPISTIAFLQP